MACTNIAIIPARGGSKGLANKILAFFSLIHIDLGANYSWPQRDNPLFELAFLKKRFGLLESQS